MTVLDGRSPEAMASLAANLLVIPCDTMVNVQRLLQRNLMESQLVKSTKSFPY